MKKVNKLLLFVFVGIVVLVIFKPGRLQAQQNEYGLGLGVATYSGDIIRMVDPGQIGLQGTFFGRRNFDNVWSVRFGASLARLNAADSVRPLDALAEARNAFFKGTLIEGHALMEFHFLDYLAPHSTTRYSPYGFFGFGYALFFGNGRSYQGNPDNLQGAAVEDYSLSTPVIPFGIGVKYHLRERLFLALEMGFRPTLTDFLDKIEYNENYISRFPDPDYVPDSGEDPPAFGINYGNKSDKDWYYFLGVTLSYSFHQVECFKY